MTTLHHYFQSLAEHARRILDALPMHAGIQPLAQTLAVLTPAIAAARPAELRRLGSLSRPRPERGDPGPVGMNSVGVLLDRLTILLCKEWYLRHRQAQPARADTIRDKQIADIVAALALARPGDPALLEKVGPATTAAGAESFAAACFDLLAANLLMWETQELLYTRDMEAVPAEELRGYIRFFSQANLARNRHIAAAERLYWSEPVAA